MAKIDNPVVVIQSGGAVLGTKSITTNGTYNASSDNLDGYSSVDVSVPSYKLGQLMNTNDLISVSKEDLQGATRLRGFGEQYQLTSVEIPNTVTVISGNCFMYCSKLASVVFESTPTITQINANAFNGCIKLVSIVLPDTIDYLGSGVFSDCKRLERVHLPALITSLPTYLFYNCYALQEVDIPEGVGKISAGSLLSCTSLTRLIFPSTTSQFEQQSLSNCTGLQKIIILASSIPILDSTSAFNHTNDCPMYVLSPDSYRIATNWTGVIDGLGNSRIFPLVSTVADLSNIDTTTYTKACVIGVDESYKEYTYDGSSWNEVI